MYVIRQMGCRRRGRSGCLRMTEVLEKTRRA